MIDISGLKKQISDVMHRFPSVEATVYRERLDGYGQPNGAVRLIGTVEMWWKTPETGDKYAIERKGQTFSEDGARWACALESADLPAVKRGDIVQIGQERYRIGNTEVRIARVFWQLIPEERE